MLPVALYEQRKAKVIAVESSRANLETMLSVLKALKFEAVHGATSIRDALSIAEVEPVNWIITTAFDDAGGNGFHLLKTILTNPSLVSTKVTFLVQDEERNYLHSAFEMGLLNSIRKPFTKSSLEAELTHCLNVLKSMKYDFTRASAHFLSAFLESEKEYQSIIELNKSLIKKYPGDHSFLVNMIKPQVLCGQKEQAKLLLHQIDLLLEKQDPEISNIRNKFFKEEDFSTTSLNEESGFGFNVLGIGECLVVDQDEAVRTTISRALHLIGINTAMEFEDGESAWEAVKKIETPPALCFLEWRIPKVSGPFLIQRLRSKFPEMRIIIVSSLVAPADMALIKEIGVSLIIEKPVDDKTIVQQLIMNTQDEQHPTNFKSCELTIRHLILAGKTEEAQLIKENYTASNSLSEIENKTLEAYFLYAQGKYENAKNNLVDIVKFGENSIVVLDLLGKCLLKLEDYNAALKIFERAQNISPKNIERLCTMAEAQLDLGIESVADDLVNLAASLDSGSEVVQTTTAKMAIIKGETNSAKEILSSLDSLSPVLSFLNGKAVALARSGRYDESIKIYQDTIQAIPDKESNSLAAVNYNLALAFARGQQLENAKDQLTHLAGISVENEGLKKKVGTLGKKVSKALATGEQIHFEPTNSQNHDDSGAIRQIDILPGEFCCYRIFAAASHLRQDIEELTAKMPKFKPRDAMFFGKK